MQRHYCRTCGAEVLNKSVCNSCGCNPSKGYSYCNDCGFVTMKHAIICVKCGRSFEKRYSSILFILASIGLLGALLVTGSFIYQAGKNSVSTSLTNDRFLQSGLIDTSNNISINPGKSFIAASAKSANHNIVNKAYPKVLVLNVFARHDILQLQNACWFSAVNQNKGSVIFIDNHNTGSIRINRNLYTLKLVSRDGVSGTLLFSNDIFDVTLSTTHANRATGKWYGMGTISVKNKINGTEIHHKIYSSCAGN